MKLPVPSHLVEFRSFSRIDVPVGRSMLDEQPVDRVWHDIESVSCLIPLVHDWLASRDMEYGFSYDWSDNRDEPNFFVLFENANHAMLFKLTWL